MMQVSRRNLLRSVICVAPVVIASSNLMPLRGIKFDPIVRVQSWPFGEEAEGSWWAHEAPMSSMKEIAFQMSQEFGKCYYGDRGDPNAIAPCNRAVLTKYQAGSETIDNENVNGSIFGLTSGSIFGLTSGYGKAEHCPDPTEVSHLDEYVALRIESEKRNSLELGKLNLIDDFTTTTLKDLVKFQNRIDSGNITVIRPLPQSSTNIVFQPFKEQSDGNWYAPKEFELTATSTNTRVRAKTLRFA